MWVVSIATYEDFLVDISERLEPLGLPVFFDLSQVPQNAENFVLIEASTSNTSATAQSGRLLEDYSQLVSIYRSGGSRTQAEATRYEAIRLLGRNKTVSHTIQKDNSQGMELYHISIRFNELLM